MHRLGKLFITTEGYRVEVGLKCAVSIYDHLTHHTNVLTNDTELGRIINKTPEMTTDFTESQFKGPLCEWLYYEISKNLHDLNSERDGNFILVDFITIWILDTVYESFRYEE